MSNQSDRKKTEEKVIIILGIVLAIFVPILTYVLKIPTEFGIGIIIGYLAYVVKCLLSLIEEVKGEKIKHVEMIVGQFYENIEDLLKREVIGGEVITSNQDYYNRATELAKNAKKIRIANFYPNPGGATGVKDADKNWLKTLEEIIKNKKEPIEVFTRIVLVNKKRWEWVKNEMINKLEGCPNYNLYYYNSESDELPIQTMVIIDEKQKSGDREEKKNVIIVNYEKGTGLFKKGLWFTDPKICAFFIEYYDHLLKPSSKELVERGEKNTSSFNVLERKYVP